MDEIQTIQYIGSLVFATLGLSLLSIIALSRRNGQAQALILMSCFCGWVSCWAGASSNLADWLGLLGLIALAAAIVCVMCAAIAVVI